MTEEYVIQRLTPEHASSVVACVRRVYGDRYAHEVFYDAGALGSSLASGRMMSVGALAPDGTLVGHMAMTNRGSNATPELGNTLVDPVARGAGLAWKIGQQLTRWCRELGYPGFIHYPTTEHDIMQKQAAKQGIETGLMLGYIPAHPRAAATVVYEPFRDLQAANPPHPIAAQSLFVPAKYAERFEAWAEQCALRRTFTIPTEKESTETLLFDQVIYKKRGLARLIVERNGQGLSEAIESLIKLNLPCLQIDLMMNDPGVSKACTTAELAGFVFAAWMPGFLGADVLRLQMWSSSETNEAPLLVNSTAQTLLQELIEASSSGID